MTVLNTLGRHNDFQIASLERILLTIKERDQIASDSQITRLARSPRNTSLTADITLHYSVHFFIISMPRLASYLQIAIADAL